MEKSSSLEGSSYKDDGAAQRPYNEQRRQYDQGYDRRYEHKLRGRTYSQRSEDQFDAVNNRGSGYEDYHQNSASDSRDLSGSDAKAPQPTPSATNRDYDDPRRQKNCESVHDERQSMAEPLRSSADRWKSLDDQRPTYTDRQHSSDQQKHVDNSNQQQPRKPFDAQRRAYEDQRRQYEDQQRRSFEGDGQRRNIAEHKRYSSNSDDYARSEDGHTRAGSYRNCDIEGPSGHVPSFGDVDDSLPHSKSPAVDFKIDFNGSKNNQSPDQRKETGRDQYALYDKERKSVSIGKESSSSVDQDWEIDDKSFAKSREKSLQPADRLAMVSKDSSPQFETQSSSWADISSDCDNSSNATFQPTTPKAQVLEESSLPRTEDVLSCDTQNIGKASQSAPSPITKERLEASDKEKEIRKNMTTLKRLNIGESADRSDSKESTSPGNKDTPHSNAASRDKGNAWNSNSSRSSKNGERTRPDSTVATKNSSNKNNNKSSQGGGEKITTNTSWAEKTAGLNTSPDTKASNSSRSSTSSNTSHNSNKTSTTTNSNNNSHTAGKQEQGASNNNKEEAIINWSSPLLETPTTTSKHQMLETEENNTNNNSAPELEYSTTAADEGGDKRTDDHGSHGGSRGVAYRGARGARGDPRGGYMSGGRGRGVGTNMSGGGYNVNSNTTYRGGRGKYGATEFSSRGRGGAPPRLKKTGPAHYDDYYYDSNYSTGYYPSQQYRHQKEWKVIADIKF